jgi:hypothetical protein
MKRSKPLQRTAFKRKPVTPTARTGILGQSSFQRTKAKPAKAKPMKSRGMKGRPPTAEEQRFMDAIASLGCLPCEKDGHPNSLVSIHHLQGRTAPGAHFLVLGLCACHHQQDDTDPLGRVSVHGRKAQFVARYGTERELLAEAKARLGL